MPSHLKRYHTEGHFHFLTFSCYRRFPYLGDDRSRTVFLDALETLRQRHRFFVFGYVPIPHSCANRVHEWGSEFQKQVLRGAQDDSSVFTIPDTE